MITDANEAAEKLQEMMDCKRGLYREMRDDIRAVLAERDELLTRDDARRHSLDVQVKAFRECRRKLTDAQVLNKRALEMLKGHGDCAQLDAIDEEGACTTSGCAHCKAAVPDEGHTPNCPYAALIRDLEEAGK